MVTREDSIDAQRNILLRWHELSAGDVSVIKVMVMQKQDSNVMTIRGCPHAYFWHQVARLEWAETVAIEEPIATMMPAMVSYRFRPNGRRMLGGFITFRLLFDNADYRHAPSGEKPPMAMTTTGVIALLPPWKYPKNTILLPSKPSFDEIARAMAANGTNRVGRYEPKESQDETLKALGRI